MSRNSSHLARDLQFALDVWRKTGSIKDLWFVKTYAAKLLAGDYN